MWQIDEKMTSWASVARAVRTPTRADDGLRADLTSQAGGGGLAAMGVLFGSPDLESEELLALEAGWRWQASPTVAFDLALFRNDYDNLITIGQGTPYFEAQPRPRIVVPLLWRNACKAQTYGGEVRRISIQSEVGQGTTFTVHLALPVIREAAATATELDGIRCVTLVRNPRQRALLATELARRGATVLGEMPESTGPMPQRAFIDPAFEGRGFSIAKELRARGCRVVMLVPFSTQGEGIKRCRELGCEWLAKPFLSTDLVRRVAGSEPLAIDAGSAPRSADAARRQIPTLRILLAEDNAVNQRYARALLQRDGHTVAVANNGIECLDLLADGGFDLILMDMQMPELDGLEATRRVRASEAGTDRHVPIIATTANAMRSDEDLCRAAGMDGYVSKPIRPDRLFEAIDQVLAAAKQ